MNIPKPKTFSLHPWPLRQRMVARRIMLASIYGALGPDNKFHHHAHRWGVVDRLPNGYERIIFIDNSQVKAFNHAAILNLESGHYRYSIRKIL